MVLGRVGGLALREDGMRRCCVIQDIVAKKLKGVGLDHPCDIRREWC
jgi:hypothetical protein